MACRSGCPTQDHATYGACLRAANFQVPKQESQYHGAAYTPRSWDAELNAYRKARAEGIQPKSTRMSDIKAAVDISRASGKRFDATTMSLAE